MLIYLFLPHTLLTCGTINIFMFLPEIKHLHLQYTLKLINFSCHLKTSGYCIYHQFSRLRLLNSGHRTYLCVFKKSQKKQRLFPYTALNDLLK
jgi:hypothetical protein